MFYNLDRYLKHRIKRLRVGREPMLDPEALAFFRERLKRSKIYLEYGSGGSTVLASALVEVLVSVESDGRFLEVVKKSLDDNPQQRRALLHVDIGLTESFGRPVFRRQTPKRLERWAQYAQAPWDWMESEGLKPDLVLVDGRFRVACALETLYRHPDPGGCEVVLDDYRSRLHYRDLETFFDRLSDHGRVVRLIGKRDVDRTALKAALEKAKADFR